MKRFALPLLAAVLAVGGCQTRPDFSYVYSKPQISQDQLLRDEQTVSTMSGVTRVHSVHHPDGSGSLEVGVTDKQHITVQQKLSELGYVRGQH